MKTKLSDMIKVRIKKKIGYVTSQIPHSNGMFPVWYKGKKTPDFILSKDVEFI